MRASNERLTILSEAEQAALYEIPDFDDVQRSNYLNLTPEEQILMRSRDNLSTQVHCAIQIGYFKAKHRFFPFKWDEVQEDIDFIMPNIEPIIKALGCKEITQSILIKKLCTYSASSKTRKGFRDI